jgi:hypothetical protein
MKKSSVVFLLCAVALSVTAPAQNINTNEQRREASSAKAAAEPKISDADRAKAIQLLEQSDAQSRAFEAPLRTYMLLQIAQAYLPLDKSKSQTLFKDAFTSSLEIRDDDDLKQRLQDPILTGLLTISQPDVEELLPQAEPPARQKATNAIIQRYLTNKNFGRAVELTEGMNSWTEFPYGTAAQVMAVLPDTMNGDFRTLFTQAVSSYSTHEHKGINIGGSLPVLIVKFAGKLPPQQVEDAIDEVLKQAKQQDNASITLSGEGGTASFGSAYDYQLFQLLPTLRKVDEGRAKKLLDEDQAVKALSQQYGNGVQSLDPGLADSPNAKPDQPRRSGLSVDVRNGDSGRSGPSPEDQMRAELDRRARQITRDSEQDPMQAIAQAMTLPASFEGGASRETALLGIAQANIKKNPMAAKQAFDELRKSSQQLKPQQQVRYFAAAAKGYVQLGEMESAQKTVSEGMKVADDLLVQDKNADDPNKAMKAWWPSVDGYRQFLEIETSISQKEALAMLSDIQDEEMQTIERVMFTNALLGKPMKQSIVSVKTKNNNSMMIHSDN